MTLQIDGLNRSMACRPSPLLGLTPAPSAKPKSRERMCLAPRRVRDREHVKFLAGQPCLVCAVDIIELHRCGDEAAWWGKVGVEPLRVANALWRILTTSDSHKAEH